MKILPFFGLFLCSLTVQGGLPLPEFDDPLHGLLIVSRTNPPFLTLKAHPNRAFYVPTDAQVEAIRHAVYSSEGRFNRSSNSISNMDDGKNGGVRNRKIAILQLKMSKNDEEEDALGALSKEDFEDGMETYLFYAKYIGRMIINMFDGYLTIPTVAPPDLPFNSFDEKTYFKATVVEVRKMTAWFEDVIATLRLHAQTRPYFPVEKVIHELRECKSVGYSEVSDKDFEFKTENGGMMTYYKVMCMRVKSNIFVFLALNDNEFVLKPITIEKDIVAIGEQCGCNGWFCWLWKCWAETYTKKEMFTENRYLTASQQKELNDYLIDRVVLRIKTDFKSKIDLAMEDSIF